MKPFQTVGHYINNERQRSLAPYIVCSSHTCQTAKVMFFCTGVKSIEILCILGVVAVIVNYLVSISFVPAALSLYAEVSDVIIII
jgi:hypothetical protein